jgi:transposase
MFKSGDTLTKSFRKLDPQKVLKLKQRGLSNSQIAERLGVTQGAVYHVLRKEGFEKSLSPPDGGAEGQEKNPADERRGDESRTP